MKRLFSRAAMTLALMVLTSASAWADTVDLSLVTTDITLNDGDVVTGTLENNVKVSIADGAIVTLNGVSINENGTFTSGDYAGINCLGNATIFLADGSTNTVKGFHENYPGIHVPNGSTLTIEGTGTLYASSNGKGAGIGGGFALSCGNIVINSGTIDATGGADAAGIGGGGLDNGVWSSISCGFITINGGNITATGGAKAPGIGSGDGVFYQEEIYYTSSCGNITINGGSINAKGGDYAVGIGVASGNSGCGDITISSNVASVTITKGNYTEKYISEKSNSVDKPCGTVTIDGVESPTPTSTFPHFSSTLSTKTNTNDTWTLTLTGGNCGTTNHESEVTWSFNSTYGTLTISGTGAMEDYVSAGRDTNQPWRSFWRDIESVVVEDGVTRLGNSAFEFLGYVKKITLGKDVQTIGNYVCKNCSIRGAVTIPPSVTEIGQGAFEENWLLNCVNMLPTTPPTLGTDAFNNFNLSTIYVPSTTETSYKTATNWLAYENIIKTGYRVTADPVANMTLTSSNGVQYGSTVYAASGETVSLTMTDPRVAPTGYTTSDSYSASAGHLSRVGDSYTSYTLEIANADVFISCFVVDNYSITYHEGEGATFSTTNTNYTIESPDITLDMPTKEHYDFAGWYTNSGLTGDPVTTIAHGSTGPKEFWAKWTPTEYSITYDLNGGILSAPETWVIKATLNKHVGNGDFGFKINGEEYAHWVFSTPSDETGKDYYYTYVGAQPSTIEFLNHNYSGSDYTSGSKSFNPNGGNFNISSKGIIGSYTIVSHNANPTTYTIESPDFTLNMPEKDGKYFAGWTGTDLNEATREVTISQGSTGNRTYTATWIDRISITTCDVLVPDQTLGSYSRIRFKFEDHPESIGEVVKVGNETLTRGVDYSFGSISYANSERNPSYYENYQDDQIGDELCVEIEGIGKYSGTTTVDFKIVSATIENEAWGDLTWSLSDGVLTITGSGAMKAAAKNDGYPWFPYASNITSITIGSGITSIADYAFAGTSNMHYYRGVTSITLPSSLTSIGEDAFAFGTGLTVNLNDLPANVVIGDNAFYKVGKVTGTLSESTDNTARIKLMDEFSKADVTLSGRTLKKDGSWNTLCLPFGLTPVDIAAQDNNDEYTCPLHGATIMELDNTAEGTRINEGVMTLKFKEAMSIEAGKPYLVKWAKPDGYDANPSNFDITNPSFTEVKIDNEVSNVVSNTDGSVAFMGMYSPYTSNGETILKESTDASALNAFHALVKVIGHASYTIEGVYEDAGFQTPASTLKAVDQNNTMTYYINKVEAAPITVAYVDENGTSKQAEALVLDASRTVLAEGTYVVNSDITYNNTITLGGDVTLILADGMTMQMGSSSQAVGFYGIVCDGDRNHNLTIYGQNGQTGSMKIYVEKNDGSAIAAKDIAIYGGKVIAHNIGYGYGISGKNIRVKTNEVNAFGGTNAIFSDGILDISGCQSLMANLKASVTDYAIKAGNVTISDGKVIVYGQKGLDCSSLNISGGTVTVECTNPNTSSILSCVNVSGDATISSGQVSINASEGVGFYIGLKASNVAVSGGQVTVTSQSTATNDYYRRIDAPVTFSYTNASDFIMADSYGSLTIANSQTVSDGTSEYSNVLSGDQLNAVRGKTLRPFKPLSLADNADNTTAINGWNGGMATVTLAGRTLYKDGKWNTLCLPFDVKDSDYDPTSASYSNNRPGGYDQKNLTGSPLAGCTLKELDTESSYSGHKTGLADDGTLYLNFKDAYEIEAGKPYLIKWDSDGTNNLTASDLVFNYAIIDKSIINVTSMDEKVTFKGTYAKQTFTDVANNKTEDKSILFLGEDNTLFYPLASQGNDYTFNAFRAFFKLNTPTAVRVFNLSFGEENESTGIVEAVANSKLNTLNSTLSEWYTMDGRKLDGKPATKGLYINNGRKVVIK